MKIVTIFTVCLLLILSSVPTNAKSSDLFIDHLSDIIFKDCQNQDLHIKNNFIFSTVTNKTVTLISWPYDYSTLRKIIQLLGENEPFDFIQATNSGSVTMTGNGNGIGILKCGEYNLDINQYTYFWRGTRVDVPKEEFKTTYGNNSPIVETHGENSPVAIGGNSWVISIFNISVREIEFSLGGFSVGGLTVYFILKRKSKKS